MKARKSGAVAIFIGVLLIVVFAVGLIVQKNPSALISKYRYDFALEQFCAFCANWWLPAGIIGFPLFLISMLLSLVRESKGNRES
jgi:hypothetical protein